jgi:hypothetical protein
LGSFTEFHRIGGFQRLTLSQRVFGRDRVDSEIARLRAPLAGESDLRPLWTSLGVNGSHVQILSSRRFSRSAE